MARRAFRIRVALLAAILAAALGTVSVRAASAPEAVLSDQLIGGRFGYVVQPGDSLTAVSARFGVGVEALARENGLSPQAWLHVGQWLHGGNPHIVPAHDQDGIWINIPQRYLFFIRSGRAVLAFPVGLGKPSWPTPVGRFTIGSREREKTWVVPKSIQEEMRRNGEEPKETVPPGPKNPLGPYWLGFRGVACGIHGTIAPTSVYRFRSHGCIRARNENAARLYDAVPVGEPVRIVYRPVLLARLPDGEIWLEAGRDVYHRDETSIRELKQLARSHGIEAAIDWKRAHAVLDARDGLAHRVGTAIGDGRTRHAGGDERGAEGALPEPGSAEGP